MFHLHCFSLHNVSFRNFSVLGVEVSYWQGTSSWPCRENSLRIKFFIGCCCLGRFLVGWITSHDRKVASWSWNNCSSGIGARRSCYMVRRMGSDGKQDSILVGFLRYAGVCYCVWDGDCPHRARNVSDKVKRQEVKWTEHSKWKFHSWHSWSMA